MKASKRRLVMLDRKGKLKARTDLPRKAPGARRARRQMLADEKNTILVTTGGEIIGKDEIVSCDSEKVTFLHHAPVIFGTQEQ